MLDQALAEWVFVTFNPGKTLDAAAKAAEVCPAPTHAESPCEACPDTCRIICARPTRS